MTNNEAKALVVYACISLAHSEGLQNLVVCGDSMMIIQALVKEPNVGGKFLSGVLFHSIEALKKFDKHSAFHIKWELNIEVDKLARMGTCLTK